MELRELTDSLQEAITSTFRDVKNKGGENYDRYVIITQT